VDLKVQKNALLLGRSILNRHASVDPFVSFISQKPEFDPSIISDPYFTNNPSEKVGIDSAYLSAFIDEVVTNETTQLHTLTIIRKNNIICSLAFFPYQMDHWNYTFSMCKSITSLAIGMLIGENKLHEDDLLVDYFGKEMSAFDRLRFKNVTVKHLLTMSTNVAFNELGSVTVNDWIKGFFTSNIKSDVGSQFDYNSMNTYVLACLVNILTGESLSDYLSKRLWQPLGINQVYWDKSPKNIEKGGWGLYLSPIDMAKIGQLYLNRGLWNNQQLVPKTWIDKCTKRQIETTKQHGDFDYGYQMWVARDNYSYLLNGMFGQNVIVIPDKEMVIVTTAGNYDSFQTNAYFKIVDRYFGKDIKFEDSLSTNRAAQKTLNELITKLGSITLHDKPKSLSILDKIRLFFKSTKQTPLLPSECTLIDNHQYQFMIDECRGIGFVPLFIQGFLNNYTKGLNKITFHVKDDHLHLIIDENDLTFDIIVGFNEVYYQTINFHGDRYDIAILGNFAYDEDDNLVLKLTFNYLEYPNIRYLKIYFKSKEAIFKFSEAPGAHYFHNNFGLLAMNNKENKLIELLTDKLDLEYLKNQVKLVIEPELYAELITDISRDKQ